MSYTVSRVKWEQAAPLLKNVREQVLPLAELLAEQSPLTTNQVKSFNSCLKNTQLLTSVLNKGYWYIE